MASPPAGASLPRKRLPPETTPEQQRRPLLPCPLTPRRARSPRADGVHDVGPERELAEWRRLRGSGRERAPCQHPPGLSSRSPGSAHSSGLRTRKAFKTSNLRSTSPTSNLNPPSASPEPVKAGSAADESALSRPIQGRQRSGTRAGGTTRQAWPQTGDRTSV